MIVKSNQRCAVLCSLTSWHISRSGASSTNEVRTHLNLRHLMACHTSTVSDVNPVSIICSHKTVAVLRVRFLAPQPYNFDVCYGAEHYIIIVPHSESISHESAPAILLLSMRLFISGHFVITRMTFNGYRTFQHTYLSSGGSTGYIVDSLTFSKSCMVFVE